MPKSGEGQTYITEKFTTRTSLRRAWKRCNLGVPECMQFLLHMWHPSCYLCYKPSDKSRVGNDLIVITILISNILAPAYGVYNSQLKRYSKACGSYHEFRDWLLLTRNLLNHGFLLVVMLNSSRKEGYSCNGGRVFNQHLINKKRILRIHGQTSVSI